MPSIILCMLSLVACFMYNSHKCMKDMKACQHGNYCTLHGFDKGGGNLLRDLDMLRSRAAYLSRDQRPQAYMEPVLGNKRSGCCDSLSGIGIGNQKRNMDEIDRSSFNSFIKKNFDEIDRSGFGSFVKRNFDEIDRSGFGSFVKRNAVPAAPAEPAHN